MMTDHKLLLVDDDENVLKSLRRLFLDTKYKVITCTSGEAGLEACKNHDVAIVVSDYRMPGMNGVEFLAQVKENFPDTIRIILSGFADVSSIVDAINDGQVYKFLAKPWNDQEILTTIQRALEHFELQKEHSQLLNDLRAANEELRDLTNNLEIQVEKRTLDLELKNRALETAQRLLNLLPVGVLGVDNMGTIVYMNHSLSSHIDISPVSLGEQIEDFSTLPSLKAMQENIKQSDTPNYCSCIDEGVRLVYAPLPDNAGIVGLFFFDDLEKYNLQNNDSLKSREMNNVNR